MCICSVTGWKYLQCSSASGLGPKPSHSPSAMWALGRGQCRAGDAWRTASAVPAQRGKRQQAPSLRLPLSRKQGWPYATPCHVSAGHEQRGSSAAPQGEMGSTSTPLLLRRTAPVSRAHAHMHPLTLTSFSQLLSTTHFRFQAFSQCRAWSSEQCG